jgi:hypothetical protein
MAMPGQACRVAACAIAIAALVGCSQKRDGAEPKLEVCQSIADLAKFGPRPSHAQLAPLLKTARAAGRHASGRLGTIAEHLREVSDGQVGLDAADSEYVQSACARMGMPIATMTTR